MAKLRAFCTICKKELDNPEDPTSEDCGGDCLQCMAEAYDPECMKKMFDLTGDYRYESQS